MRHQKTRNKLSRSSSHRKALLMNLCKEVIEHERIKTSEAKAKAVKPELEKLITLFEPRYHYWVRDPEISTFALHETAAARVKPDSRVNASPKAASTDCALPTDESWLWIDCRSGSVRSPICIRASTKNRRPNSVGSRPAEVCGA